VKTQRGFRLEQDTLKRIDDLGERMDVSYNHVVTQCVKGFLPVMESSEYYEARLAGMELEEISAMVVKAMREKLKK